MEEQIVEQNANEQDDYGILFGNTWFWFSLDPPFEVLHNQEDSIKDVVFPNLHEYIYQQSGVQPRDFDSTNEKIYTNAKVTWSEAYLLVKKFHVQHKISKEEYKRILCLIDAFVPQGK